MRFITVHQQDGAEKGLAGDRSFINTDQIVSFTINADNFYATFRTSCGREWMSPRQFATENHLVQWILKSPHAKFWQDEEHYDNYRVDPDLMVYVNDVSTLDHEGSEVKFVLSEDDDHTDLIVFADGKRAEKFVPQDDIDLFFEESEKDPEDIEALAFYWRQHVIELVKMIRGETGLTVRDFLRDKGLTEEQIDKAEPEFAEKVRQLYIKKHGHEPISITAALADTQQ